MISAAGPVDSSCILEVPNGFHVLTTSTGSIEASLSGSVVASATASPACTASGALNAAQGNDGAALAISKGGATGGWYENSWTNAVQMSGFQQFDYAEAEFTVPPPGPSDTTLMYLFPSVENVTGTVSACPHGSGCGTIVSILQPILQWGYNTYNGGGYWMLESAAYYTHWIYSPPCYVNSGDDIVAYMEEVAANPDEWLIYSYDISNSCATWLYYDLPSGQPEFNTFQGGVLEGYGNANETAPLASCSDLPSSNGQWFQTIALEQAGPAWNSYHSVLGQSSWQAYYNCESGSTCFSPNNCAWGASASNNYLGSGEVGTLLVWQK